MRLSPSLALVMLLTFAASVFWGWGTRDWVGPLEGSPDPHVGPLEGS